MKNDREVRPTWVLWWLLAILISVVCIAFTGVKRAYAQDVRTIKDSKGKVTHTIRTRNDGSREIRDASGRLEGTVGNNFKHFDYICVWQMKLLSPRCDWT